MTTASYRRTFPARPFSTATRDVDVTLRPIRAVQKLSYVALQRIFVDSESNQLYFAKQTIESPVASAPTSQPNEKSDKEIDTTRENEGPPKEQQSSDVASPTFQRGEKAVIVKRGSSFHGTHCEVVNPDWHGQVKVKVGGLGLEDPFKSYLSTDLKKIPQPDMDEETKQIVSQYEGLEIVDKKKYEPESWITNLMKKLEDPLGAAVTLSELLSTNEYLLTTFVNEPLVEEFARMVSLCIPFALNLGSAFSDILIPGRRYGTSATIDGLLRANLHNRRPSDQAEPGDGPAIGVGKRFAAGRNADQIPT